jgi:hypothetical protein
MSEPTRQVKDPGLSPRVNEKQPPKRLIKEGEPLMSNVQQNDQPTKSKRNSNTGGIHQLPSGSWELRWYVTDQSGNRKRVSTTVKGSKKNAQAKLREVLSAVDNGSHVDKSKETVEQFAVRWMETYVATNCTIRTEIGYQGNIDRYIVPAGGGSGSAVYYQSWQQPV